jgi:ERCC4-type nuclease
MSITAVLIDRREPPHIQALKFGSAMVAVTMLDYGDMLVTCDDMALLAIERKTASDLLNSIREDRLWAQLAGIKALTPWAYLLVAGDLRCGDDGNAVADGRATGWSWAAVQGALLQAQELGVHVVYCNGDGDVEAAVMRLAARSHHAKVVIPPAREPRVLTDAERVLFALPGIGPEKAPAILEYCRTGAWALVMLTELTGKEYIPGVGLGIKRAARKAFGLGPDEQLGIVCVEKDEETQ